MISTDGYDYCLVGGGLQSGLIAAALRAYQPERRVLILERAAALCGNHTWSCHETDIPSSCRDWFYEIPGRSWADYEVRFGQFRRVVPLPYRSIRADAVREFLHQLAMASESRLQIVLGAEVVAVAATEVGLADGRKIAAECVVDCRGPSFTQVTGGRGYQKFFGWEVQLQRAWSDVRPLLMDVPTDQRAGFRFMYVLPFSERRLLLQDTYFSDTAEIDVAGSSRHVAAYLSDHGQADFTVTREEHGCLPMPFGSPLAVDQQLRPSSGLAAGYRGGWFHVATGYSLPLALQVADAIARAPIASVQAHLAELETRHQWRSRFGGFLNRLLFRLVPPRERQAIFRRFYQSLPAGLIGRFYAHEFSRLDALRIFLGWPPRGLTWHRWLASFRGER
jgi:lycopene beta-cyclase